MKHFLFMAGASALAIAATTPAEAAIFIGVGVNGGAVTQVATDAGTGSANYVTLAGSYIYNAGAAGAPLLIGPNLLTQSINIEQPTGTGGVLNLYITQTDQTAFNGILTSTFTSNTVSNASAVLRSFISTSNALFGGTQLQSASFNSLGTASGSNAFNIATLFSTTVRYDITFGAGASNFNGTANLTAAPAAVPEPASWAMMLLGFGGFGYAMRRRQKVGTRIRFA